MMPEQLEYDAVTVNLWCRGYVRALATLGLVTIDGNRLTPEEWSAFRTLEISKFRPAKAFSRIILSSMFGPVMGPGVQILIDIMLDDPAKFWNELRD